MCSDYDSECDVEGDSDCESESDCDSDSESMKKMKVILTNELLNLPEMNPPEGQGQGEPGAQGLRLIIQACQRLYPQQPNPLQVHL